MNTSYFYSLLKENSGLDQPLLQELLAGCQHIHIKKGDRVLSKGEILGQSYYVENGLLRYYSIDDKGKEHILQFAPEGWFVSDRQSACLNTASDFFIDALEDSDIVLLDENFLNELAKKSDKFLNFNNRLLHNHIRQLQNRINQLLSYTAEERYLDFVKIYPDILLRVPQTMVASYLGITPESLSRVRKELAKRYK